MLKMKLIPFQIVWFGGHYVYPSSAQATVCLLIILRVQQMLESVCWVSHILLPVKEVHGNQAFFFSDFLLTFNKSNSIIMIKYPQYVVVALATKTENE